MSHKVNERRENGRQVLAVYAFGPERVDIGVKPSEEESERTAIAMRRADFIAAIEAELQVRLVPADAIVIERSALPEVDGEAYRNGSLAEADPVKAARDLALHYLAVAEHLAAHPPVDPAVTELAEYMERAWRPEKGWADLALTLHEHGWRSADPGWTRRANR